MQAITDKSHRTEWPRNLYLFADITFISGVSFTWVIQPLPDRGVTTRTKWKKQTPTAAVLPVKHKRQEGKEPALKPQSAAQSPAPDAPATTGPQGKLTGRAAPKAAV